jgi:hypothetical protein
MSMSFLSHFFADDERLAQQLAQDGSSLHASLERYEAACKLKAQILDQLQSGVSVKEALPQLRFALSDEIAVIAASGAEQGNTLSVVDTLKEQHALDNLTASLNYAASREHYVYELMRRLYGVLCSQATTVNQLIHDPENQALTQSLLGQLQLEQFMAQQLHQVPELERFYIELANGARTKHELTEEEHIFAEDLLHRMLDSQWDFKPKARDTIEFLTSLCFNYLQTNLSTPQERFAFVNDDKFSIFVRDRINEYNLEKMNDRNRIAQFAKIFQELYSEFIEHEMY